MEIIDKFIKLFFLLTTESGYDKYLASRINGAGATQTMGVTEVVIPIFCSVKERRIDMKEGEYPSGILGVGELATYLRLSPITVYRLLGKRGENHFPGHRVGGQWRFYREDVDKWVRGSEVGNELI